MPEYVELSFSNDGKDFMKIGQKKNTVPQDEWGTIIKDFTINFYPKKIRYFKVFAKNIGKCPEWHKGAGGEAFIFADEIVIK